jgi:hypothetical protein
VSGMVWLGEDASITRSNVLDEPEERTERDEAADWLLAFLADGAKPAEDVLRAAKKNGIAEKTLRRARPRRAWNPRRRRTLMGGSRIGGGASRVQMANMRASPAAIWAMWT